MTQVQAGITRVQLSTQPTATLRHHVQVCQWSHPVSYPTDTVGSHNLGKSDEARCYLFTPVYKSLSRNAEKQG